MGNVLHRTADVHVHLPGDRVGERRAAALVLHDDDVDARLQAEELGSEVLEAADARGGRVQLAGLALCQRDELLQRAHRQRGRHDEQARTGADRRDRHEPLQRFVGQLPERDAHREAHRDEKQRVAIGRRFRRGIDADGAASAATVVDDHPLPEALAELRGHHASYDVVRAARRERDDEPHRLRRIGLRVRPSSQKQEEKAQDKAHRHILALYLRRSVRRYSTVCISCRRLTVRWNSAACSPAVNKSSGSAAAETIRFTRSS